MSVALRDKALALLTGDSPILATAREVTALCRAHGLHGAVIGGVAAMLHGHVRATPDVDVYSPDAERVRDLLLDEGYAFDASVRTSPTPCAVAHPLDDGAVAAPERLFREGVPVHLVAPAHVPDPPRTFEEIDAVQTIGLADLIDMKLRSGLRDMLRAQDLADVIGLIRRHGLRGDFATRLRGDVRSEFRKLAGEIERRG